MPRRSAESSHARGAAVGRRTLQVRPGWFITLVIVSCLLVGAVILWLLRSMRF